MYRFITDMKEMFNWKITRMEDLYVIYVIDLLLIQICQCNLLYRFITDTKEMFNLKITEMEDLYVGNLLH